MRGKKAIKNVITSLLLQFVTIICGLIVPILIIKTYGSETNGLINSITQFLTYIALLEAGFGPVIKAILYKPIAKRDKRGIQNILKTTEKFFRRIATVFIVYIVILMVVFPNFLAKEFDAIYSISLILILSISTFAEYFFGMTYRLYLEAEQKSYVVSYINIVTTILSTILVVILVNIGASIQAVKLITAFVFILKPILQNIYVKKKYHINLDSARGNIKIKQKWDGLAQHIAAVIHGSTDIAVLTIFTNIKEVSVYSVYLLVIKGVKNIVSSLGKGIDSSFGDMIARGEYANLNRKFNTYEFIYHTLATIIFTCTLVLIVPFVTVYTLGVEDVNYIRPEFATLIVLAEFVWAIRSPYSSITLAAGHFKETKKGAWVEAISNIVISVILVFNYGIIGVAIGTLVSMVIRTIEFMYHTSRYILKRNVFKPFLRIILIAIEVIIVINIGQDIKVNTMNNYLDWFVYAIRVGIVSSVIVVLINCIFYRREIKNVVRIIKNIISKKS